MLRDAPFGTKPWCSAGHRLTALWTMWSGAVLKWPAFVAGLDDLAMTGEELLKENPVHHAQPRSGRARPMEAPVTARLALRARGRRWCSTRMMRADNNDAVEAARQKVSTTTSS